VVVVDRDPAPVGKAVLADLSDTASSAAALEEVLAGGPVRRLVNNVGAVFPGPVQEQRLNQVDAAYAPLGVTVPVRRVGQPDDIAHAAGFFLDQRAGFVNG